MINIVLQTSIKVLYIQSGRSHKAFVEKKAVWLNGYDGCYAADGLTVVKHWCYISSAGWNNYRQCDCNRLYIRRATKTEIKTIKNARLT